MIRSATAVVGRVVLVVDQSSTPLIRELYRFKRAERGDVSHEMTSPAMNQPSSTLSINHYTSSSSRIVATILRSSTGAAHRRSRLESMELRHLKQRLAPTSIASLCTTGRLSI